MTRDEAYNLVVSMTDNKNLIKHMIAVEAEMGVLYDYFKKNGKKDDSTQKLTKEDWKVAGLIHDADYEKNPDKHPRVLVEKLQENKEPDWLVSVVETHAWKYNGFEKEPANLLEWSLYTCDELSGFIIACALVRPDKKLASLEVSSILKKWGKRDFAKGVKREQIEMCEEKLGIRLIDYVEICLEALQGISDELGL